MSGHSKWSTIKHKKGATDAKRGKLFSQLSKNIRIAVKDGGTGDSKNNPALRLALDKARAGNMPNDIVQRAIDRGLGKGKTGRIEEILYEGFGPGGVGFLVTVLTENKQRTGAQVRNIFSKNEGSLGGPGSVKYLFKRSENGSDYVPNMPMSITDEHTQKQIQSLVDALRDNEDVEDIFYSAVWEGQE